MFVRLDPPPQVAQETEREVANVLSRYETTKVNLSKTKRKLLERKVRLWVEEWQSGSSSLHDKLRERLKFFESDEEQTDFPFGSGQSSNLDVRYAVNQCRTMRANFIRSVFSDPQLIVAKMKPGAKRDEEVNKAEAAINWDLSENTNAVDTLKDTPNPIFRDGTGLVWGEWSRRVERGVDQKTYANVAEFQADYPDHEAAGVSEEKYAKIITELDLYQEELHCEYELDFVSENSAKYTDFPLAKLIWYPLWIKDIREARLYGFHYRMDGAEFDARVAQGFFNEEAALECRKSSGSFGEFRGWDEANEQIEGLDGADQDGTSYDLAKLIVTIDLDNDSIPETYIVHWDLEAHKSLREERYSLWRNVPCVVPFRWIRRGGRFLGDSLLGDGMDLYREINALHRHRSNVRRLTDSVTLVLPKSLKEDVDLGAEYAQFKPGMTLWIPDAMMQQGRMPTQLQLYNLSRSNDSMDEENLVGRYLDGLAGITQSQGGRESGDDPKAPGNKTAMLLARADIRGEDMILEWSRSIPHFVDLHRALLKSNSESKMGFMRKAQGEYESSEVNISTITAPNLGFALKPAKLDIHPELEMNKIAALAAAAMRFGFPAQLNPDILIHLWNDFVIASRIENPERYQAKPMSGGGVQMGGREMGGSDFQMMIQQLMGAGNANGNGATAGRRPSGSAKTGQRPVAAS